MKIKIIKNGALDENCYILSEEDKYLIIDPGSGFDKIKESVNGEVLGILITHRHFDHIGALRECMNEYKCPIYDKNTTNEETYKEIVDALNAIPESYQISADDLLKIWEEENTAVT